MEAGSICRCSCELGQSLYVVVLAPPTPGRQWLVVLPLGQPPEFRQHPLRPHLRLQAVQWICSDDPKPPAVLREAPLLLGDRLTSVAIEELETPIARISAEQLQRLRQLGALALGLRPSDLRQPPSLGLSAC
jgi:hypothetical protein